jgi:ABC-type oligopeptide transport system substrate-binding subunit
MSWINELLSGDLQKIYNNSDWKIIYAIFEGLMVLDSKIMKSLPGVVKQWNISSDKKIYNVF